MADHSGLGQAPGPGSSSGPEPDSSSADPTASRALVVEGTELVAAAADAGVTLRLLGGVGVVLHCPGLAGMPHRHINDIDGAIPRDEGKRLERLLSERGYDSEARFNALHGDTRLIFHGPHGKLDVFVGRFSMCHRLELADRLSLGYPTIPLSDLLATKLQVVELSTQDIADLELLFREHELGDDVSDSIDAGYLSQLLANDWGFWKSATASLERLADDVPALDVKVGALRQAIDEAPKSRRWRMRARIGERLPWYETPGDVG